MILEGPAAEGWKHCVHGYYKECNACYILSVTATQASAFAAYAEAIRHDKDALTIADTLPEPDRRYFLEDDLLIGGIHVRKT